MNKITKVLIVASATAALASGAAACGSAGSSAQSSAGSSATVPVSSQSSAGSSAPAPVSSAPPAGNSGQSSSCTVVDATDNIAVGVTGGNQWDQWCAEAMDGQFASDFASMSIYGTFQAGSVPSGSPDVCSVSYNGADAPMPGVILTIYGTGNAMSVCDYLENIGGQVTWATESEP